MTQSPSEMLEAVYGNLYTQQSAITEQFGSAPDVDEFFTGFDDLERYDQLCDTWAKLRPGTTPPAIEVLCGGYEQGPSFTARMTWYAQQLNLEAATQAGEQAAQEPPADPAPTIAPDPDVWSVHTRWHNPYTIDNKKRDGINAVVAVVRQFLDMRRIEVKKIEKENGVTIEKIVPKDFFKGREDIKSYWDFIDAWPAGVEDCPHLEDICAAYHTGPSFAERMAMWRQAIAPAFNFKQADAPIHAASLSERAEQSPLLSPQPDDPLPDAQARLNLIGTLINELQECYDRVAQLIEEYKADTAER